LIKKTTYKPVQSLGYITTVFEAFTRLMIANSTPEGKVNFQLPVDLQVDLEQAAIYPESGIQQSTN